MSEAEFPKFINHQPIGKDLFEGRPQEKVAKSIADQIRASSVSKLIGLDGAWGSGKSNVISILETELTKSHHIYVYDAWGHQEDLQRKSFLEGLTSDLLAENLLSSKTRCKDLKGNDHYCTWKEKLSFLLSRKKTVDHSKSPAFRAGIFWVVAMIVLTPILSFSSDLIDQLGFPEAYVSIAKILFSLSAVIIGVLLWLLHSLLKWQNPAKGLATLYYIYKGRELSYTTHEAISDSEPSVTEFKEWMTDISEGLKKGLIIAFDNMDRLPPQNIKELWSSIHTFFAEGHSEYDKIWVIIPFDRVHLRDAFVTEKGVEIADQFINKTFSIVYRVSPPILTDWKAYFEHLFQEAFGDNENNQVTIVMSLFDLLKERFTPRDIIAFINDLVALKKLWGDEIELKYMALFSLKNVSIDEAPLKKIISEDFLGAEKKFFSSLADMQNNMAALTFNVPVSKAYQVVLHRELELALREGGTVPALRKNNISSLSELSKHEHFFDVLEDVISKSEYDLDSAVSVLKNIELAEPEQVKESLQFQAIWSELLRRYSDTEITTVAFNSTLQTLMIKVSSEQLENLIRETLLEFSKIVKQKDAGNPIGKGLYIALEEMQRSLNLTKSPLLINELFPVTKLSPQTFLGYLGEAKAEYEQYPVEYDFEEMDKECANFDPEHMERVQPVKYLERPEGVEFNETNEKLDELRSNNGITSANFHAFLIAKKAVTKKKPFEPFDEPLLYTLLTQVTPETLGYFDLLAMRISYGQGFQTTLIQKVQPVNHQKEDPCAAQLGVTDADTVAEISKVIEFYMCYGDLLELLSAWNQPLLKATLVHLTNKPVGTSSMHVISVLKNYDVIFTNLQVSEKQFLTRLSAWHEVAEKEITVTNVAETVPSPLFFTHAGNLNLKITNHVTKQMVGYFNELSLADWKTSLSDKNSYNFKVLSILISNHHISQLPEDAVTAYKELLTDMASGAHALVDEFFGAFYNSINKNKLKVTFKQIRDAYINHDDISCEQFLVFAEPLKQHAELGEKPGEVVRRVLTPVVENAECRELILGSSDYFIPLIKAAGDDAEDFKDKIRLICGSSDEPELKSFAKDINIAM